MGYLRENNNMTEDNIKISQSLLRSHFKFQCKFLTGFYRSFSSYNSVLAEEDINQVVLLGRFNFARSPEDSTKNHLMLSMLTRNTYKGVKGFGTVYFTHRIYIFDPILMNKACSLEKGCRICVVGSLSTYQIAEKWHQCIIANKISLFMKSKQEISETNSDLSSDSLFESESDQILNAEELVNQTIKK